MANLRLIKEIHKKFETDSPLKSIDFETIDLSEAINQIRIEKAFSDKIEELGPAYSLYFNSGYPVELALLYIDICSFSMKNEQMADMDLIDYLNLYYDQILEIICKYGGEVDKIMGDGIVCLFGPPFLENNIQKNIDLALKCSKEIIKVTKGGDFESKIALHAGQIRYYKNTSINYEEYTIIGKMMTELFRLESISEAAKINYYSETVVDEFIKRKICVSGSKPKGLAVSPKWKVSKDHSITPQLRGVDFKKYKTISYNS